MGTHSLRSTRFLVGSNGFRPSSSSLGTSPSGFRFSMRPLYQMLRIRAIGICQHSLVPERAVSMPWQPTLTPTWLVLATQTYTNWSNTALKSSNGTSSTLATTGTPEEPLRSSNSRVGERKPTSRPPTTSWLEHSISTSPKINSTRPTAEESEAFK